MVIDDLITQCKVLRDYFLYFRQTPVYHAHLKQNTAQSIPYNVKTLSAIYSFKLRLS